MIAVCQRFPKCKWVVYSIIMSNFYFQSSGVYAINVLFHQNICCFIIVNTQSIFNTLTDSWPIRWLIFLIVFVNILPDASVISCLFPLAIFPRKKLAIHSSFSPEKWLFSCFPPRKADFIVDFPLFYSQITPR